MSIKAEDKMPKGKPKEIEKYILRKAFDCPERQFIPEEILWR